MKRVMLAALSTVAGLTLLLSFKTRRSTPVAAAPAAAGSAPSTTSGSPTDAGPGAAGLPGSTTTTPAASTRTVTGNAIQTRYGPVQVKISVTNGQVTDVTAVRYPTESSRDAQINAYAIPVLNQEAAAAKSAKVDMVSGATYTSTGYITSLQSAINMAGLG